LLYVESESGSNNLAKVQGLLQDNLGIGAWDCSMVKIWARIMGGLPKHKCI
jgi:hypothetical protein